MAKNVDLKKLSGNELSETMALLAEINRKIREYCHVSDYLPKNLTSEIDAFNDALLREYDRREDEL